MNEKIKISLIFFVIIFYTFLIFINFCFVQTYIKGILINFNGYQIIQTKNTNTVNFVEGQKILLKIKNKNYKLSIINVEKDAFFYYLIVSKNLITNEDVNHVDIYDKKIRIGEYIIKEISN